MEAYSNNRPLDQQPPQETIAYVPQPEVQSAQIEEIDDNTRQALLGEGLRDFILSQTVFEPVSIAAAEPTAHTEHDETNPSIILSID